MVEVHDHRYDVDEVHGDRHRRLRTRAREGAPDGVGEVAPVDLGGMVERMHRVGAGQVRHPYRRFHSAAHAANGDSVVGVCGHGQVDRGNVRAVGVDDGDAGGVGGGACGIRGEREQA